MPLYRQPKSPYWWVRFSIGGQKTRRSSGTTSRSAAEEFETKLRADLWRQIKLGERPKYTFREAIEHWYELADHREREHDRARLKWFEPYLNDVLLAEIGRERIEKLRVLKAGQTSRATANRYMALLRTILRRAALEWDWIDRAPQVPMYSLERHESRYLTRAQFAALKRELAPHLAVLAEFSVQTGLRLANACGLTWQQVDLKRRMLIVPAARAKAGETISVPLSASALTILRTERGKHPERVFTFRGKPFRRPDWMVFKAAASRADVPWLRWHDLRHTWASWHIQAGTPPYILQELGGWRSFAVMKNYAHLSTEHLREYVEHRKGIPHRKRA